MARPNPFEGAQEIRQLLVDYAKQETVTPLRSLGRYLGYGLAGSLLVFLGASFAGLGLLRLMQSLSPFKGSSWASTLPYVIAIAALGLLAVMIAAAMQRARRAVVGPRR